MGTLERLKAEQEKTQRELHQLENRQKILLNKQRDAERRARTRRLIEQGAILEGVFPMIAGMTSEEVKAFLIDLSRLPEAAALSAKFQKFGDAGEVHWLQGRTYAPFSVRCAPRGLWRAMDAMGRVSP